MNSREFKEKLSGRANKAEIAIPPGLSEQLWTYFQLLAKWNAKINLTALNLHDPTPEDIDRLLIEPLVAAAHAEGARTLIDIGTGGGSPAFPLALALPAARLVMVEVKTRKSIFLREAVRELGLSGASVITARYEGLLPDPSFHDAFDLLSVRAVRVEAGVLTAFQAFIKPGGKIFHFRSVAEAAPRLLPPLQVTGVHTLGEASQGQLLVMTKVQSVPRGTLRS